MIPVSLSTMRDAMDSTTKAQITQRIGSEVMSTPFEQVSQQLDGKLYYFDQEGFQQTVADGSTRFQVKLGLKSAEYPGVTGDTEDGSILTMLMHITFYGRSVNAVASEVALNVPNQNGKSRLPSTSTP